MVSEHLVTVFRRVTDELPTIHPELRETDRHAYQRVLWAVNRQMTFPPTLIDKIRQRPKSKNLDLRRLDSRAETWATRRWYSLLQGTGQCCKMSWSLRDSPLGGRRNNLPFYENKMAVISVFSGSRSGMWTGSCMESTLLPEPGQRRKAGYEGRGAPIERRGQRRGARRETGDEEGLPQDETCHKEGLA